MPLKLALPKGPLMAETAALLNEAGLGLKGYHEKARFYRLESVTFSGLTAKIFHERDIPIQVAIGNYDLGICGLDWIEELLSKYPSSDLIKLRDLGYGEGALYMIGEPDSSFAELRLSQDLVRLASEYPNLAEARALDQRLRRFSIFPLWGGAEVYPPEGADLALVRGEVGKKAFDYGLVSLEKVCQYRAYLIANHTSWEAKDLSMVLRAVEKAVLAGSGLSQVSGKRKEPAVPLPKVTAKPAADNIRLALPDGHQQGPAVELLRKAGIGITDYPSASGNRRPEINLEGVTVKVIRPQDMPLQVANGNFDLAISGKDWLREHRYQFPSSRVDELLDLKFGKVRIVVVVKQEVAVEDSEGLRRLSEQQSSPIRVASEYISIADKYARDNHLAMYRIVPTWGATEAFLPEDADVLIENTQTGTTIAKHNLKIIDTLAESSGCLIGRREELSPARRARQEAIINTLRKAVED